MTGDDLAREVQARCDARVAEAVAAERQRIAEEIAQGIEQVMTGAPYRARHAYDHAAWIARMHAVPDCGHEYHGADGGPCPRCGFDIASVTGSSAVAKAAVHRITHTPPRSAVLDRPGHPGTRPQSESLDSPKGES